MKMIYMVATLALFAFSLNAVEHQNELAQAVISSANGDIMKDSRVRSAMGKVCADRIMGTALTGEPDTTCLRALK